MPINYLLNYIQQIFNHCQPLITIFFVQGLENMKIILTIYHKTIAKEQILLTNEVHLHNGSFNQTLVHTLKPIRKRKKQIHKVDRSI